MTIMTSNQKLAIKVEQTSLDAVKDISLSLDNWTFDMEPHEEDATDKILEYLIQSGARPFVTATGDIIDIVTSITNTLTQSVPPHLSHPLKVMTDYIARWLCDYVEKTNANTLRVSFGFDAKIMPEESS